MKEIEQVIVTARKDRKMTDGTPINLGRTNDEQGFRVTKDSIVSMANCKFPVVGD